MKKKVFLVFGCLVLVFNATMASAVTIELIQLFSDNRAGAGYTLWAGADLSGDYESNASVKLEKGGDIRQIPVISYFFDESSYLFRATDPAPTGFGGVPGDFEGELLTFTITDPDTAPGGIKVYLTPHGLQEIQMMSDFVVERIGLNPTIAWMDPGSAIIHHYRIRVLSDIGDRVYDSGNIYYAAAGGENGTFWFAPGSQNIGGTTIPGFTFQPGKYYTLRIEARQWLDISDFGTGGDFVPAQNQAYYLNRSVSQIYYIAEAAADIDNDDEVDGLDLQSFILAYAAGTVQVADLNGDGIVDGDDVAVLSWEFGRI